MEGDSLSEDLTFAMGRLFIVWAGGDHGFLPGGRAEAKA